MAAFCHSTGCRHWIDSRVSHAPTALYVLVRLEWNTLAFKLELPCDLFQIFLDAQPLHSKYSNNGRRVAT